MPFPGSTDILSLTVTPFDGTTGATVVVNGPSAGPLSPVAVTTDGGNTWTATAVYPAAGRWVAVWTVTGTGAGITEEEIWVSQVASPAALVAWRPELWQVAAYVPRRTLVGAVDGYGQALWTFDSTTTPPSHVVQLLITDACAWVAAKVDPVTDSLGGLAASAAAVRAAGIVELTYPDNRDDLTTAETLLAQATQLRADLDEANEAATGTDPEDPTANLLPEFAFPPACATSVWDVATFL